MARWLLALVPLRIALDLVGGAEVSGVSVGQAGSAAIAAILAGAVALRWRIAVEHPWRAPMAAFAMAVAIGAVRASSPFDAARYGLHLLTPILWLLALHVARRSGSDGEDVLPRSWALAATVPIALSLGAWTAGQPADHVLHGFPRLIGAYANLHSHATAMAVFASTFLLDRRYRVLGVAAAACVAATWVRTAWLWVGLALLLAAVARRRGGAVLVLVFAAVAGVLVLRERWADVLSLLTLTPPAEGWGALGSWRGRIWAESLAGYLAGPPADVWLGRGLGGQYGLHRHLDPHSEWLALLYQLGPLGLLTWLGWMGTALVDLGRRARRSDQALVAFAVLGGAVATSPVSNDWLVRATPILWTFGLVGIALRAPSDPGEASGSEASGSEAAPAPEAGDGDDARTGPRTA